MVEPGIPVDAADLQDAAGAVQEGLEYCRTQSLHGLVKGIHILLFVGQEPVPVVVHANAPEKINGLRGETCKHKKSFLLCLPLGEGGPPGPDEGW